MAAAHASSQTHAILNLPLGNASGATNDFSATARREDAEYRLRDGVLSGRESPAGEETPLLRPRASSASTAPKEASELNASINLVNTIIGAGIVSLPYACALTGFASFVALVAMTQMMTKETIGWLCKAADAVGQTTLYATTRVLLGDYAEVALRLTVLVNNYGLLIVYLVVGGDVMAGGAGVEEKGLLAQWFPQTCDVATPHWACTREFFTAMLAATLLLPLCSTLCALTVVPTHPLGRAPARAAIMMREPDSRSRSREKLVPDLLQAEKIPEDSQICDSSRC